MAAHLQPARSLHHRALVLGAVLVALLAAPAEASAHATSPVVALDFEARVVSVGEAAGDGIRAQVLDGDRKLELRVDGAHHVLVLGYAGEPFLRFSPAGVDVNTRSPTAITDRVAPPGSTPALSAVATPVWSKVAAGVSFAWHDHRLGPVPGRRYGEGDVGGWSIPLVVDGRSERIVGRLHHSEGPPYWVLLMVLAVTAALAAMVARTRSPRTIEWVAVGGALIGAAAGLALSISVGLSSGRTSTSAWGNVAFASLDAAAALLVVVLGRQARVAVAGLVALFAALVAVSYTGVLVHGYAIAALPADAVRAVTVAAVTGGMLAVTATLVHFFSLDAARRRRPAARAVRR